MHLDREDKERLSAIVALALLFVAIGMFYYVGHTYLGMVD